MKNKLPKTQKQQTIYLQYYFILVCQLCTHGGPIFTLVVFVQVLLLSKALSTLFALEGFVSKFMHTFMPPEVPQMQEAHWTSRTLVGPFACVCFDMHC